MKQDAKLCVGVLAGIMGAANVAHAVVVEYAPASPFIWTPQRLFNAPPFQSPPNAMDITQPPSQSGAITPVSVYQWFGEPMTSSQPVELLWTSGGSVSFAVTPVANFAGWNRPGPQSSPPSYSAPREYLNGQTIDASATFASTVTVGWTNGFQPFRNDYGIVQFTPPNGPTIINITPPDDFVVGLKLNMSGQDYFGWMAVHWLVDSRSGYNITRWACETTPNTPIAVPAPGVCGVAAAGLLAAIRRRRRVASEARPPLPGTATVSGQGGGSACGRVR